jgi:hypothetical protein
VSTVVVWVLVITLQTHGASVGASSLVVDNISSRENCRSLARIIGEKHAISGDASCTAVRKARL